MTFFRVQAGKCGGQEVWCALDVDRPQLFPDGVQAGTVLQGERGVVGVGDHVKVRRCQSAFAQAPAHGLDRKFPRGEGNRFLAVFAAGEPLFLGRGDDPAIDHQGGRWIVEDGVDAEHLHGLLPSEVGTASTDHMQSTTKSEHH